MVFGCARGIAGGLLAVSQAVDEVDANEFENVFDAVANFHVRLLVEGRNGGQLVALHVASGLWALASALSRRSAVFFLKVFGTLYFLDGVMGVFTGSGYLDLSIFIDGIRNTSTMVKVLSSLPHLGLGAFGIAVGFSPWTNSDKTRAVA